MHFTQCTRERRVFLALILMLFHRVCVFLPRTTFRLHMLAAQYPVRWLVVWQLICNAHPTLSMKAQRYAHVEQFHVLWISLVKSKRLGGEEEPEGDASMDEQIFF